MHRRGGDLGHGFLHNNAVRPRHPASPHHQPQQGRRGARQAESRLPDLPQRVVAGTPRWQGWYRLLCSSHRAEAFRCVWRGHTAPQAQSPPNHGQIIAKLVGRPHGPSGSNPSMMITMKRPLQFVSPPNPTCTSSPPSAPRSTITKHHELERPDHTRTPQKGNWGLACGFFHCINAHHPCAGR